MNKIIKVFVVGVLFATTASSQTIYDAAKFVDQDLNGTARFVGMGGAMGALGGDISTIGTNPAGIGIYRSNDIMTSFSLSAYGTESKYADKTFNNDKNRWSFDNIGFVFSSKIGTQTPLRYVNFAFNYKKNKSFFKNMSMGGNLNLTPDKEVVSQTFQMANQANAMNQFENNDIATLDKDGVNLFDDNYTGWLAALGWKGNLYLKDTQNGDYFIQSPRPSSDFYSREKGGIDQYDFNVAFNFYDRIYLGVTIGAYDLDYYKFTSYREDYGDQQNYFLESDNRINGAGVDFKIGAIFRPVESSPFRIGIALHTPIFYKLTYTTNAFLRSNIWIPSENDPNTENLIQTDVDTYKALNGNMKQEFRLRTPWKYNVSLGYTIGTSLALGAEYEYQDYSSVQFSDTEGYTEGYSHENATSDALKGVSTFRIGAEYKIIPQFAFRLGYNYRSAIFKDDAFKNLQYNSIHTDTDFANKKAQNNYTLGIGYRGTMFYADLAYQYSSYKENFYAFDDEFLDKTKVTNTRSQVLLTLGMRF